VVWERCAVAVGLPTVLPSPSGWQAAAEALAQQADGRARQLGRLKEVHEDRLQQAATQVTPPQPQHMAHPGGTN